MIPVHLTMHGFACYRDRTEIDFTNLDADLFAIAGPTGSGKSAILDAITFALYGQTARLGARGVLDSLVSPGADRMVVTLTFATNGETFRVTRQVAARASGAAQEVRVERWRDGDWHQLPASEKVRDANAALERITGLDYDGFTRAVLLPQGAFDEFLRGDPGKRRALLTTLLGLGRLDAMRSAARERERSARTEHEALTARLQEDYGDATPDALAALDDEIARLAATDREAREKAERLAMRVTRIDTLAGIEHRLATARGQRDEARAALDQLGDVRLYDAAATLRPHAQALTRAQAEADAAEAEVDRVHAELVTARAEHTRATTTEQERRAARDAARATLAAFHEHRATLERAERALLHHGRTLAHAEHADDELFSVDEWEAHQQARADAERLTRLHATLTDARARAARAADRLATAQEALAAIDTELPEAEQAFDAAEKRVDEVHAQRDRLLEHRHAHAIRADLTDGDACPVCGGTYDPDAAPPLDHDIDLPDQAIAEAEASAKEAAQRVARLRAQRESYAEQIPDLTRDSADADAALATARDAVTEAGGDPDEPHAIEDALAEREDMLLARAAGMLRTFLGTAGGTVADHERRLTTNADTADRLASEAAQAASERGTEVARLEARLDAARDAAGRAVATRDDAATTLNDALHASPFDTLDDAEPYLLTPDAIDAKRAEADAATRTLQEAEARIATLEQDEAVARDAAGDDAHPPHREAIRREVRDAQHNVDTLARMAGTYQAKRDDLAARIERAADLRARMTKAEARADTFHQLHRDLHGDQFPAFLLSKAQDALAARASHVLRQLTDDRYDLVLQEGEFHVRDAWNTGLPRSVRTLSGGETFIASLALALALSDILLGHAELGALFLDEGFGTLDAAALDAVASALENLTRSGRMVGIISHIDSLTERMPARLLIEKRAAGSTARWDA